MKTIAFFNQKGGVGKTSSVFHLSAALAATGRRVLAVDNDPQGSLTQGVIGPVAFNKLGPRATLASVYAGNRPFPEEITVATARERLDLVPGHSGIDLFNHPAPELAPAEQQQCIREFLTQVDAEYDFALIDCPPNRYGASWSALVAADCVVIPLQPEDYGAQGIAPVLATMSDVHAGPNPGVRLLGFLVTMYDRRIGIHHVFRRKLAEMYPGDVFENPFPRASAFLEAVASRKSIVDHKPRSPGAIAVRAIADELVSRVDGLIAATTEQR